MGYTELGSLQRGRTYRGLVDLDKPNSVEIAWHDVVDGDPVGDEDDSADAIRPRLARIDDLLRDGTITTEEHSTARREILGGLSGA